ncbi:hypothetical protein GCM10027347_59710 [Larkinella harenae]
MNILQLLAGLNQGLVVEKATNELKKLTKECDRTNRSGELKIVIKLKPNANSNMVGISAKVKATLPDPEPFESGLFADVDGNLSKEDPNDLFSKGDAKVTSIGMGVPKRIDFTEPTPSQAQGE